MYRHVGACRSDTMKTSPQRHVSIGGNSPDTGRPTATGV
ncbi:hypothetical protein V7x_05210 [Crateriforma conspicua]|uniref:Uncharacterized protein n=1 Tax=Crateriforma conspicua TaxID=2527996 RepID=A0A5C6FP97_9PLAN|nr:hypothetical protein V7x_05210 [Crateriforma conspicua]